MPKPRCSQVSLASTPYYHCVSRCVPKTLRGAGSPQSLFMRQRLNNLTYTRSD